MHNKYILKWENAEMGATSERCILIYAFHSENVRYLLNAMNLANLHCLYPTQCMDFVEDFHTQTLEKKKKRSVDTITKQQPQIGGNNNMK